MPIAKDIIVRTVEAGIPILLANGGKGPWVTKSKRKVQTNDKSVLRLFSI
jgi:hypothetical protein